MIAFQGGEIAVVTGEQIPRLSPLRLGAHEFGENGLGLALRVFRVGGAKLARHDFSELNVRLRQRESLLLIVRRGALDELHHDLHGIEEGFHRLIELALVALRKGVLDLAASEQELLLRGKFLPDHLRIHEQGHLGERLRGEVRLAITARALSKLIPCARTFVAVVAVLGVGFNGGRERRHGVFEKRQSLDPVPGIGLQRSQPAAGAAQQGAPPRDVCVFWLLLQQER